MKNDVIIEPVVSRHAEEAAFLWLLRLKSPDMTISGLYQRLEAGHMRQALVAWFTGLTG